jgi:hypothetical protein
MISETEIFKWLDNSPLVSGYEVLDFHEDTESYLLKLRINFTDRSELFARESIKRNLRQYSYHWQTNEGQLNIRWDNAKYHKELSTYPHHRHEKEESKVFENKEVFIMEILELIRRKIAHSI